MSEALWANGYTSMVYATSVITILSFSVWLHHFFTMGSSSNVNIFFGIATMLIAVLRREDFQLAFHHVSWPHKVCYADVLDPGIHRDLRRRGSAGVMMSIPPAHYVLHNSLFLSLISAMC